METREKLTAYFGEDCDIYARYSNTENGILGQETGTEGTYLLNWASYYFEILKLDSDKPVEQRELGRIIVTDLYNKAFPMIRYDTGDVARMVYPEKGFPYFTKLLGWRMDGPVCIRNSIAFCPQAFHPVVKCPRLDMVFHVPLVIGHAAGTALYNKVILFLR